MTPNTPKPLYPSRRVKRARRTKSQLSELYDRLFALVEADRPMTVRQVFYQAVTAGIIPKTEAAYESSVMEPLLKMRRSGRLPWEWISDHTRWQRKPHTYSSLDDALRRTAQLYRRSVWVDQSAYVEIWLEKDALAGVIGEVTDEWDVPLMVTRGFSSASFLYGGAKAIKAAGKPTYLYYLGDRDPSGVHIDRKIESGLRELAPGAEIHFERVAVLPDQIRAWGLPTRETKQTDSRAKGFEGESCELDAIPPAGLRRLVRDCIEKHVNPRHLSSLLAAERSEREYLTAFAQARRAGVAYS